MALSESDTRSKLIDLALHACDWTEDLIRREETAGAIAIEDGKTQGKSQRPRGGRGTGFVEKTRKRQ